MKRLVYIVIVTCDPQEGHSIVGVFSSEREADNCRIEHLTQTPYPPDIIKWEVDGKEV